MSGRYGRRAAMLRLAALYVLGRGYHRRFAWELIAAGRGRGGEPWEVRRLAALLLQGLVLRIPAERLDEMDLLLVELGLKPAAGLEVPLADAVLREGYSTTRLEELVPQLRRRLERGAHVLRRLERLPGPGAWRGLLALARCECRLPLARYLFTPEEVASRILGWTRTSRGARQPPAPQHPHVAAGAERALAALPPLEAELLARLLDPGRVLWVAAETPAEPWSLLEEPAGTVVLVIKPPGSCAEVEVKRTGRRGPRPLAVVYERDGEPVPVSHRLDGGSMGSSLGWDAYASSLLAEVYRRAHGTEAPLPRTLAVSTVASVPAPTGEVPVEEHFEAERRSGDALRRAVEAFAAEKDEPPPEPADDGSLTARFLRQVAPAQAALLGTSSFRLDRLAALLAGGGDALVHGLLEEMLGVCAPPPRARRGSYAEAALALPANRRRADAAFRAAAAEIGRLWGTLIALGGSTHGESFVARNVGLRAVWEQGDWRVRLVLMDHDGMRAGGYDVDPLDVYRGMPIDELYVQQTLEILGDLYRVSLEVAAEGWAALRIALSAAFARVRQDPDLMADLLAGTALDWALTWAEPVLELLAGGDTATLPEGYAAALADVAGLMTAYGLCQAPEGAVSGSVQGSEIAVSFPTPVDRIQE